MKDDNKTVVSFPGASSSKKLTAAEAKKQARKHCPRGMKPDAKKVCDRTVPEMILANRFKPIHIEFFRNYSVVVARMEKFLEFLEDEDNGWKYTTTGRSGVQHKTRPEAAQYNDDWRKWNTMVNQMGASPATDLKFQTMQPDLFGDDPYVGY